MKIVVTGTTGYIGKRLLSTLAARGHELICPVRDPRRFEAPELTQSIIRPIKADLLDAVSLQKLPRDVDAVYYLVHSMQASCGSFAEMEAEAASNFADYLKTTSARQVIFLSGIANDEQLSKHLSSRKNVEHILQGSGVPLTTLRAAIIIGSGSASFEIIRDLVEKLPFMVAPRWLNTRCQPIAIRNVIDYLEGVLDNENTFNQVFDIGGPDILTYKQMLQGYAKVRGLKRLIVTVPVLSPGLSSYWLYFVTSTSFTLARSLVASMKNEVICRHQGIKDIIPLQLVPYENALQLAFQKISQNEVISSWTDTLAGSHVPQNYLDFIQVPRNGCLTDSQRLEFSGNSEKVMANIWSIGGARGWYYGNFLWKVRGALDKMVGGVGLRRGRRSPDTLYPGDALDFWRVLLADKAKKRLLLYA
jgi:uncharacterized protein YbjT (DUF2867 family)